MTEPTAKKLYGAAKRLGMTDRGDRDRVRVQKNYSGRGMFGRQTIALVIPGAATLAAMAAAARVKRADREAFAREVLDLAQDSMGRDSIVVY